MKRKSEWIDMELLRAFQAEGTDAHRLCTIRDGWVERYGRDVIISYKNEPTREWLTDELQLWSKTAGLEFDRIFGRFLPRQNEERERPRLLSGDPQDALQAIVHERKLR